MFEKLREIGLRLSCIIYGDPDRFSKGEYTPEDMWKAAETKLPDGSQVGVEIINDKKGISHLCGWGGNNELYIYGPSGWLPAKDFDVEVRVKD